jgi:hypothetical protein
MSDYDNEEKEVKFEENRICCPICGDAYGMHHTKIEIFNRSSDDMITNHYIFQNGKISNNYDGKKANEENPSLRRSGIKIKFYCESCNDKEFTLCLAQHKGSTFLYWE